MPNRMIFLGIDGLAVRVSLYWFLDTLGFVRVAGEFLGTMVVWANPGAREAPVHPRSSACSTLLE